MGGIFELQDILDRITYVSVECGRFYEISGTISTVLMKKFRHTQGLLVQNCNEQKIYEKCNVINKMLIYKKNF